MRKQATNNDVIHFYVRKFEDRNNGKHK